MKIVMAYLLVINIAAFFMYGEDKRRAKKGQYRISEACLIGMALLGGSIGTWSGMQFFRHKTKHLKFTIGVPVIFLIQLAVILYGYIR